MGPERPRMAPVGPHLWGHRPGAPHVCRVVAVLGGTPSLGTPQCPRWVTGAPGDIPDVLSGTDVGDASAMSSMGSRCLGTPQSPQWDPDVWGDPDVDGTSMSPTGHRCLGTLGYTQRDHDAGDAPTMSSMGSRCLGTSPCPQRPSDVWGLWGVLNRTHTFGDTGMSPEGRRYWGTSQCPQWDPDVWAHPNGTQMLGTLR